MTPHWVECSVCHRVQDLNDPRWQCEHSVLPRVWLEIGAPLAETRMAGPPVLVLTHRDMGFKAVEVLVG